MSTPARRLRERLSRPGPVLVVGAHSPLSARLAERAGFDAIWASGFEISAAHGVPDANILTMAEQLQAAREMARSVSIPVIADCDNGFGNAINVIRTVQDYEADGIAGICIGGVALVALLSGHLRLDVHGFGIVVLLQAVWLIWIGVLLGRRA